MTLRAMNYIASAFSEINGKPSSHRLLTGLACGVVLGVWAAVSIEKKDLQPLSVEQSAIVLGGLGIGAYKRGVEGKSDSLPKSNP